jgi:predicted DCC family thiol-disulfide oxidoreductase YuxK
MMRSAMKNGWTGGQYSLVRAVLGAYLCGQLAPVIACEPAMATAGCLGAVLLAVGMFDRVAASACLAVIALLFFRGPLAANAAVPFIGWLLILHLVVPPAPYGSLAARGRVDPKGDWRLRGAVVEALWLGLALGYIYYGFAVWKHAPVGMVVVHLFAFDPGWVRGVRPRDETLFYDGHCGLCHIAVRFALAESAETDTLTFAPLFGETFRDGALAESDLPDSIVISTTDGEILVRSRAALHLGNRLGGYWRVLGLAARVVPRRIADWIYDKIARVRHRLFGRPSDACPILPPALRQRMLP